MLLLSSSSNVASLRSSFANVGPASSPFIVELNNNNNNNNSNNNDNNDNHNNYTASSLVDAVVDVDSDPIATSNTSNASSSNATATGPNDDIMQAEQRAVSNNNTHCRFQLTCLILSSLASVCVRCDSIRKGSWLRVAHGRSCTPSCLHVVDEDGSCCGYNWVWVLCVRSVGGLFVGGTAVDGRFRADSLAKQLEHWQQRSQRVSRRRQAQRYI
jgi:putative component of membrane protein insertase Oxa1/YidC/SpoIIIJ protein YidD